MRHLTCWNQRDRLDTGVLDRGVAMFSPFLCELQIQELQEIFSQTTTNEQNTDDILSLKTSCVNILVKKLDWNKYIYPLK